MARSIRIIPDIEYLIRSEMERCEDCQDVALAYVQWHMPNEDGGCNWDVPMFRGNPEGVRQCRNAIHVYVQELQAKHNIPDPE